MRLRPTGGTSTTIQPKEERRWTEGPSRELRQCNLTAVYGLFDEAKKMESRCAGYCVWFSRGGHPETYGLDASAVLAGLANVSENAVVAAMRINGDGTAHSLILKGSDPALSQVALSLREQAVSLGVTVVVRPWPEYADAWSTTP